METLEPTLEDLIARRKLLQDALDSILIGQKVVSVQRGARRIQYTEGNLPELRREIAALNDKIAALTGQPVTGRMFQIRHVRHV